MNKTDEMRRKLAGLACSSRDASVREFCTTLLRCLNEVDEEYSDMIVSELSNQKDMYDKMISSLEGENKRLTKEVERLTGECDSLGRKVREWKRKCLDKSGGWPNLWLWSKPDSSLPDEIKNKYDKIISERNEYKDKMEWYREQYHLLLAGVYNDSNPKDAKYGVKITYI